MSGCGRRDQCAPAQGQTSWERMPAMYEISEVRPRGISSSQSSSRELPILFHLIDVSRPRAKPPLSRKWTKLMRKAFSKG